MFAALRQRPRPNWFRRVVAGLTTVAFLAAAGAIAYRVLVPTETLDPADRAYPARDVAFQRSVGVLANAPLILGSRLRVYAEKRRVWADTPADAHRQTTPYWSLRRWPAELIGVVAVEGDGPDVAPIVVTEWSDGAVVALDARVGRIVWRTTTDALPAGNSGLTAATTTYEPPRLRTSRAAADGRPVVFTAGAGTVRAYDPWSGTLRWEHPKGRCLAGWTGETTYVLPVGCSGSNSMEVLDAGTGRLLNSWSAPATSGDGEITPWACAVGNSECRLLRTRAGGQARHWLLGHDGSITAEPHAGADTAFALDDAYIDYRADRDVTLVDRATGLVRWSEPLSGYVIGADDHGVYVITRQYDLVGLDRESGQITLRLDLRGTEPRPWTAGHVYIRDRYVAIERLLGKPTDPDTRRFYGPTPVLLMAV
jgi:outer membrane protein assembly factor BamB